VSQPTTMGAYLRAARRKRRVSIERAADDTRIRADFLMRMESDEFDFLAPAYVRGFLKTYARFLRVDPDPLLHEFDYKYGTGRVDTAQVLASDRIGKVPKERRPLNNWTVAAIVAAVGLVSLFFIGLVSSPQEPLSERAVRPTEAPTSPRTRVVSPVLPSTQTTTTPVVPEEETIALDDGIDVQIRAISARCWVEIQADGAAAPAFKGTLEIGDVETVHADSEMSIVLGYAAGVELTVNGHNLGAPGGPSVQTIHLPQDLDSLVSG
jgi:cytoskeleton protein RodZ